MIRRALSSFVSLGPAGPLLGHRSVTMSRAMDAEIKIPAMGESIKVCTEDVGARYR